jgi:hypothetical protein
MSELIQTMDTVIIMHAEVCYDLAMPKPNSNQW